MHIDEAMRQIAEIRGQMARGEVFRGYRAATVALSGVAGIVAAAVQPLWVASPMVDVGRYVAVWGTVAGAMLVVAGAEVLWRARRSGSGLARRHTLLAVEHFLPSVVVGGLLTISVYRAAPEAAWMLPGLWAMIFGLGVFASARLLPRQVWLVGCWYIACGCGCLLWGRGERAFSPWLMGVTFGGGQLLAAAVLYWTLERSDGSSASE